MPPAENPQFESDLAMVRTGRIFFSHHSVGRNVLEGIARVVSDTGAAPLKVASLEEAATTAGPVLLHGSGGQNRDPESKIAFFQTVFRENPDLRPDVAFMKFCYVDFGPGTEVDALFARYERAINALKREYPEIRFAHVTAPLTRRPVDLKSSVRRLLGLDVREDATNAKLHEFNRKLAQTFSSDPVFDLAGVESTAPDGTPVSFELRGRRLPSMAPAYTDDGGHLNVSGQRVAGAAAIRFLAAALAGRRENMIVRVESRN